MNGNSILRSGRVYIQKMSRFRFFGALPPRTVNDITSTQEDILTWVSIPEFKPTMLMNQFWT